MKRCEMFLCGAGMFLAATVLAQQSAEPMGPSSRRTGLVISEIMYHPSDRTDGRNLEYVEIHNTQVFPENLSGYRLSGDIEFTFPNITLTNGGFLLVAASPADIQSVLRISSNVLGPYTNNLPDDHGTVRLRNRSGALLLEVNYRDESPWPLAADGAGHSLVLARPSYGENNPRAWGISDVIGGSPRQGDTNKTDATRAVLINEILARADDATNNFIEFYNTGNANVDISGCGVSDDPLQTKYRLPAGTTLPAHAYLLLPQSILPFQLSPAGGELYFFNATKTRVIDALRYDGQARNVSVGRSPDGGPNYRELSSRTPGGANAAPLGFDVVINEIMYSPISGSDDDEFVELFNRGSGSVSLAGWRFIDGIDFVFPTNAVISPGGYLVVARDASRLRSKYSQLNTNNTLGDFKGTLSNSGERLALGMPEFISFTATNGIAASKTVYRVVTEVSYGTGGRWGKWSDGGGSSLELIDARSDPRLAANWADSDESNKSQWTVFEQMGVLDNGTGAANQLQIILLGEGEALVDNVEVLDQLGMNVVTNPGFETDATGWFFQGTHVRSGLETSDGYNSARSLHVRASARGDNACNRIRTPLSRELQANTIATLRARVRWLRGNPEILMRLKGNYLEAFGKMAPPENPGTPGARNSRTLANGSPAIADVSHRPTLPNANQPVIVTARIADPDGLATGGVKLMYRLDPSTTYSTVQMTDNGTGADTQANDGIWSGAIPGLASGTLVAFMVEATDRATPSATARFPIDAPVRECLVRFGDAPPPSKFGTYRLWITRANHDAWAAREKLSNDPLDATFVYGTNRVVYNIKTWYSGSPYTSPGYNTPSGILCGYNFIMPDDDSVMGATDFVLDWPIRDDTDQREQLMFWFLSQLDLPHLYRRYVNVIVNGIPQTTRANWGVASTLYDDVQQPGSDVTSEWFEHDDKGTLWKTDCWEEFTDASDREPAPAGCILNSLQNFVTSGGVKKTARYRWNWRPRATRSQNHFEDLFALVNAANSTNAYYRRFIEEEVDVENWMRTFAMDDLASFWDAFGNPNAKNTYLYKPEHDGWKLFSWDFDVGLGVFGDPVDAALFPDNVDPTIKLMYAYPAFVRAYWRAIDESLNTFYKNSVIDPILDQKYAGIRAAGITNIAIPSAIKTWISQRRTFLQNQLATVNSTFTITSNSGSDFSTSSNLVSLTGTAPVPVKTIRVNGVAYPADWDSVTAWRIRYPLAAGTNRLAVQGFDLRGNLITNASRNINVTYTGPARLPQDYIVINEIMYHPAVAGTGFVEIQNTSTNHTFGLSRVRMAGAGFSFPDGTIIEPGGFLVVAENRRKFAGIYGRTIPIFGECKLDPDTETLSLIQPGATPAQDVLIDSVTYGDRAPWPAAADGSGPSLQLIDPTRDNRRVANWAAAIPATPEWQKVTISGNATDSSLLLYLNSAGDVFIDDLVLVAGTTPETGPNLLQNGDFESALSGPWHVSSNLSASSISTTVKHGGTGSLHLVASLPGTDINSSVWQTTSLPLIANTPYTLSYWFLPSTNGSGMTVRLNANGIYTNHILRPFQTVLYSPGKTNTVAGSLDPFPLLWINEVMANNVNGIHDNAGEHDPWIELFNAGTTAVSLNGMFLSDNFTNLTRWAFPAGASLNPGEHRLVWMDGQTAQATLTELHAGFRLSAPDGTVVLSRNQPGGVGVLDYLTYRGLGPDQSYGSYPDGDPGKRQYFGAPSPGAANTNVVMKVWINEWMADNQSGVADPADGDYEDWFELYNPNGVAVNVSGWTLTDDALNVRKYVIPEGTTIPAGGYLVVWADEEGSQNAGGDLHVNFKLSSTGETIGLYGPNGDKVDEVTFGLAVTDASQGRYPDGALEPYVKLGGPTPGRANVLGGGNEVMKVLKVERAVDGTVRVEWESVAGRVYRLEYRERLTDGTWVGLTGDVTATGTKSEKVDTSAAGIGQRFYRVLRVQ